MRNLVAESSLWIPHKLLETAIIFNLPFLKYYNKNVSIITSVVLIPLISQVHHKHRLTKHKLYLPLWANGHLSQLA